MYSIGNECIFDCLVPTLILLVFWLGKHGEVVIRRHLVPSCQLKCSTKLNESSTRPARTSLIFSSAFPADIRTSLARPF
jgi:hypothetical protein